jgi:circadian clock protein KaiB
MKRRGGRRPANRPSEEVTYRLRLFVAGNEPHSAQARATLERLCQHALRGRCHIEVVDVFQHYQAALEYQVVAVPTLIIEEPPPVRYLVGSLSDEATVRAALGIEGGTP